jgi:ABC-type multidrug transport system fused ATPase/permease subunit
VSRTSLDLNFIQRLPLGYETRVGESGIALSGGQRHRIAIARALYNKPSPRRVKKNMDQLLKGRISFVFAHRLSTIGDADLILVIEKGKIVEQGRHEELMEGQALIIISAVSSWSFKRFFLLFCVC